MKTFGRAGKRELSTTNGLQMFQTKKPFWIVTTEIEAKEKEAGLVEISLLSEYDLVSNSLIWKDWSWKSSSDTARRCESQFSEGEESFPK